MGYGCTLTVSEGAIPGMSEQYEEKIRELAERAHMKSEMRRGGATTTGGAKGAGLGGINDERDQGPVDEALLSPHDDGGSMHGNSKATYMTFASV